MRPLLAALLAVAASATGAAQPLYPGLSGAALRDALRADLAATRTLGYGPARDSLYAWEQRTYGAVCGVYTGFCVTLEPGADPSTSAFQQGVNAEHAWPQSRGVEPEPQRSDLHALFPARANVNSSRGNHPYAEIPDHETQAWYRLAESQSNTPAGFLDEWSERTASYPGTPYAARFEPRETATGDVARAVAYMAVAYEPAVGAADERGFLATMLADLRDWNTQDPPDDQERRRDAQVTAWQGAGNPFVAEHALLDRAFADGYGAGAPGPGGPTAAGPLWINELHYDDVGVDDDEFVELAGPAGARLDGWRLVLYNGNGGTVYADRALSGVIPDHDAGLGTLAVAYPTNGLQNGPDGIALVDPSGAVVQFLSYEGVMAGVGGPADGLVSADLGVEESSDTAEGQSLGLVGTGREPADFAWAAGPATPGTLNAGQAARVATPDEGSPGVPTFVLGPPAPNPSSGAVRFTLALAAPAPVRAVVVDALGREVAVAYDGVAPGHLDLRVNTAALAPGAYVLRAVAADGLAARRFTVTR